MNDRKQKVVTREGAGPVLYRMLFIGLLLCLAVLSAGRCPAAHDRFDASVAPERFAEVRDAGVPAEKQTPPVGASGEDDAFGLVEVSHPPPPVSKGTIIALDISLVFLGVIVILLLIANFHRKRAAESLKAARDRYENMFKNNAVALFEEDCLALKEEVEHLQASGIADMAAYLDSHPQQVREMAGMPKVLDVNPAALRLYGADSKEELLESFGRIFTPDSLDGFKQVVVAVAEGRSSLECETVSQKLTGQRLYVILSVTFPPTREEFSRILFSVVDITERKRSIEVMHRSEERFRSVFNNAASGMALVDLRGHYIRVNEAFHRMLGYSAKELEWKNWREVTHPEDISLTKRMIISLIAGQHVQPVEKRYIDKQGKTIWALLNIALIVNKRRKPLYYVTQVQDISELKKEQENMREREERYRQIFEADLSGFYIAKPGGELLMCNKVFCDILGFSAPEEAFGSDISGFFREPGLFSRLLDTLAEKKKFEYVEVELLRRDGAAIHVHLNGIGRFSGGGALIEIIGYLMDITRQKQLEVQLLHARKMESIGTMAEGVAHDFNNLLTGILGNVSLLMLDLKADHADFDRLKNIEQHVKSGSDLTRLLLGLARGGKYRTRIVDLNAMLRRSIGTFARTHKNLEVRTDLEKDLRPVEVDPGQIDQVLYNMYLNAWQAMEYGGELFVGTRNKVITEEEDTHGMKPGNYVEVEITDNGCGIAPKVLPRIFDPFYSTKERGRAAGLGLSSSYGIVQSHGGFINVRSREHEGTSFFILLPASEAQAAETAPDSDIVPGSGTVMLVDDEEVVVIAVGRMLERLGYNVLTADNGNDAVETYKLWRSDIDLVMLDAKVAGAEGGDALARLRQIDPEVPVLLATGVHPDERCDEALGSGYRGMIRKPFSLGQLSQKLVEILQPSCFHEKTGLADT